MAVTVTVPLAAQQPVVLSNHAALKDQVKLYETVVQRAVQRGAERLAQLARQVAPVELWMDRAVVAGVYLPDSGFHFDVQVPDISGLVLLEVMAQRAGRGSLTVASGQSGKVTSTGVVPDDPKTGPAPPPAPFNPNVVYGNLVRSALVDAMLDNSGGLPIQGGQFLSVRARVPAALNAGPLPLDEERELLLMIRGEDLLAFRQGQISREAAVTRIREYRY